MMQNSPSFRVNIWFDIFVKSSAKKTGREGAHNYESWCEEQSNVVLRNNIQNSIFVRATPDEADIFQKFVSVFIIKEIFGDFTSHIIQL